LREALREKIDSQGPAVVRYEDVEGRQNPLQADMLVIVLSPVPERGLEVLRKVRRQSSGYLLAVGQASDSRLILRALHEGADLFLDEAELETGLEAAQSRILEKEETASPTGRLIAVLACSGGSGAST